jgi:recombinational DNA repair protein (RecF pathway)
MAWERDKADEPAFLKCVLCGKEVHQEKFYKKSGKKSSKEAISEANSAQQGQEKPAKKDYKWRFIHVQK